MEWHRMLGKPMMRETPAAPARTALALSADQQLLAGCTVFMALYYGLLLTGTRFDLLHPMPYGLTFNSMLVHLLTGRFDVDPLAVGWEGFLRNGHVYAYWGIFCAFLRLPLLLWPPLLQSTDITRLSCLVAICTAGYFKLWSLLLVARSAPACRTRKLLVGCCGAWLLLGGAQVGFLRASIYQEVVFWADALAAVFVFAAIRGILLRHFSARTLALMATMAGLSVNTRISTGVGLFAAFCLLLGVLILQSARSATQKRLSLSCLAKAALQRRIILPAALLAVFLLVGAIVNIGRWGNPLVFADYRYYIYNATFPDRVARSANEGLFNLGRLPFGLIYYVLPVWVLHGPDGRLLLDAWRERLVDAAELPPGSFLLTDATPLLLCIMVVRYAMLRRVWSSARSQTVAIATGLTIPGLLMLVAISMNYRYRMEFYPLLEFTGLLAIIPLSHRGTTTPLSPRPRMVLVLLTALGIIAAHVLLLLYQLSPFGPGQDHLRAGIVALYRQALLAALHH